MADPKSMQKNIIKIQEKCTLQALISMFIIFLLLNRIVLSMNKTLDTYITKLYKSSENCVICHFLTSYL